MLSSLAYLRYRVNLHSDHGGLQMEAGANVTAANAGGDDAALPMYQQQARNGVENAGIALGDGFPI